MRQARRTECERPHNDQSAADGAERDAEYEEGVNDEPRRLLEHPAQEDAESDDARNRRDHGQRRPSPRRARPSCCRVCTGERRESPRGAVRRRQGEEERPPLKKWRTRAEHQSSAAQEQEERAHPPERARERRGSHVLAMTLGGRHRHDQQTRTHQCACLEPQLTRRIGHTAP